MLHELKTDPSVFSESFAGMKMFEIRFDDRNYKVGDGLLLRETRHSGAEMQAGATLEYTGRTLLARVTNILHGPVYGLAAGWVIMSVEFEND